MEQQPFRRVEQENFTTNPKIQQCWENGGCFSAFGSKLQMIAGRVHARLIAYGKVAAQGGGCTASNLAEVPGKASQTQALEAVHFVLTAAAVQAR